MKKVLTIGLATLLLQGCFYQSVSNYDIERASEVCGGVTNVVSINIWFDGTEVAHCKGAKLVRLKE